MIYPKSIICRKCKKGKPIEAFYKNSRNGNIKDYTCRKCYSDAYPEDRKLSILYKRKMRALFPDKKKAETLEYRRKYPERYKAVTALNNAIRLGKVYKNPCEVCGDYKSQGHHPDYSKPLEVKWLCAKHHKLEHNKVLNIP